MRKMYVGVDLHKKKFVVCYYDGASKSFSEYTFDEKGIQEFLARVHRFQQEKYYVCVAVEMMTGTYYFHDKIAPSVDEVCVVAVQQFKVIAQSSKKTDRRDSQLLAEYYERGLLPTVYVPSAAIREMRSLANMRKNAVKERSKCKNEIQALLLTNGIKIPQRCLGTRKHKEALEKLPLSSLVYRQMLDLLIAKLHRLNEEIAMLEQVMESLCTSHKEIEAMVEKLRSIPGVGKLSAMILTATIADISRFPTSKSLAAYVGLVPRVRNSGESVRHGHISKQGNTLARTILIQDAWGMLKSKNGALKSFYKALAYRSCKGKAVVAVARKITTIIHALLVKNEFFNRELYSVNTKTS